MHERDNPSFWDESIKFLHEVVNVLLLVVFFFREKRVSVAIRVKDMTKNIKWGRLMKNREMVTNKRLRCGRNVPLGHVPV
jgi:hypothetical protein